MDTKNTNCPCPNEACDNHGSCLPCGEKHEAAGNLSYCKRGEEVVDSAPTKNPKCACPNLKCKRHGDCAACGKNHGGKRMYCTAKDGGFRKKLVDFIFRKNKKKMDAENAEKCADAQQAIVAEENQHHE